MATSKSYNATLLASVANAAGGQKTSSTLNLTTALGAVITGKITNGSGTLTTPASCVINISGDGTTWKEAFRETAGLAASGEYPFFFELPAPVMYAQVVFGDNTGDSVTVEAQAQVLTGL